jgi:drug/metabolite transporter (DMT)-like permease
MKVAAAPPVPQLLSRLFSAIRSPHIALIAAALFWSGNFVAGRALREDISPVTLNFLRWLIALMILAPFVARDVAAGRHIIRREWRLVVALGATGIAAFHSMTYVALLYTTATNALLMLALVPVLILAGENIFNRQCPSFAQIAGTLVSAVGAGVLITRGDLIDASNLTFNSGDLWMLAGIVVWAAYSLLLRRRPCDLEQPVALTASIVAALAMLAPFVAISALLDPAPVVSVRVVFGVGYVAIFASAIAFLCWSYGVTEIGAGRAGQFVHLMPIFGAALSVALLSETINAAQIAGAALVAVGIALVNRSA